MEITSFLNFQWICEDRFQPQLSDFCSIRGRFFSFIAFCKIILLLPWVVVLKAFKTFFKGVGVLFGAFVLVMSLGCSEGCREFFLSRLSSLAQDVAGWCFFVCGVALELCKSFLGFLVHPAIYFHL